MGGKSFFIRTFGCQMNCYDSRRIANKLLEKGFSYSEKLLSSDIIIVNTCSVREKAENKVFSYLGELKGIKGSKILVVCGCMAERLGAEIIKRMPFVDLVLGPDATYSLDEFIDRFNFENKVVDTKFNDQFGEESFFCEPKVSEYLAVMKGCNENCSYCVVPTVRGREKSKPLKTILSQVEELAKSGAKEIVFLGQNINTYGDGKDEKLARLIEMVNKIDGIKRIRYVTSHPKYLSGELIEQFGSIEKLCPALHLPVQSGSDKVLKLMNRKYTRMDFLEKVEKLRKTRPNIAISTDFIVGFPGETEEDFSLSLSLAKEVGFSQGFLFKYSRRPGTVAYKYGELSDEIKKERLKRLQEVVFSLIEKENKGLIGSSIKVLVESIDKKNKCYAGRDPRGKLVHILNGSADLVGKEVDVKITKASISNLSGELANHWLKT